MKKLTPTAVTPSSIMARKKLKPTKPVQKKILSVKQIFDWTSIQKTEVNGLVQSRPSIRALEGYLDTAPIDLFHAQEFSCGLNQLRKELRKVFVLSSDDQEVRQTFFVNDVVGYSKILTNQTGTYNFNVQINPALPKIPEIVDGMMSLILTYRGVDLSLKQSISGEVTPVSPYGAAMIKGSEFDPNDKGLVEWSGQSKDQDAFYIILSANTKKFRR